MKQFKNVLVLVACMLIITSCGVTFKLGSHDINQNNNVKTRNNKVEVVVGLELEENVQ